MVQAISTNTFTTAKWIVSSDATQGTHTTIAGAITSASSGDTIFIRPGTYTENLTLKVGVNIVAFAGDGDEPNVIISGKATLTTAGTVTISNIRLQTNSDFFLAVTGSAASIVNLNNCYLNCLNNTGISFTSSSGSSLINISNCRGDLGTTGIAWFAQSASGTITVINAFITNSGGSSTASTCSAGIFNSELGNFAFPITFSGTSSTTFEHTLIYTSAQNVTSLTAGGSGSQSFKWCRFDSGSASSVSIGTTAGMEFCHVGSSNTNAVTGAGTLNLGEIVFTGSSSTINTSTVNSLVTKMGSLGLNTALTVPNGGSGIITATAYGLIAAGTTATGAFQSTATGAAASTVLIGNGSGALPTFSATPQLTALGIGAAAGASGLTFDGTNLLANYATALWTPNLQISGSNTGITYSVQAGGYTRIGNIVTAWFNIILTAKGANTGAVTISNFPIALSTNGGNQVGPVSYVNNVTAVGYTGVFILFAASSTVGALYLTSVTGAAVGAMVGTQVAANSSFAGIVTYILD